MALVGSLIKPQKYPLQSEIANLEELDAVGKLKDYSDEPEIKIDMATGKDVTVKSDINFSEGSIQMIKDGGWVDTDATSNFKPPSAAQLKVLQLNEKIQIRVNQIQLCLVIDEEELLDECTKIVNNTGQTLEEVLKQMMYLVQYNTKLPWRQK